MNERDSEQVARMFVEGGYTLTRAEEDADAILVNTCSVRDQAEQKALGKMGMMGKHREKRAHVVSIICSSLKPVRCCPRGYVLSLL